MSNECRAYEVALDSPTMRTEAQDTGYPLHSHGPDEPWSVRLITQSTKGAGDGDQEWNSRQ